MRLLQNTLDIKSALIMNQFAFEMKHFVSFVWIKHKTLLKHLSNVTQKLVTTPLPAVFVPRPHKVR